MVRQLAGWNETYLVPDVRFGSDYLLLASFSNLPLCLIQQWVLQCLVCRELNLVQYSLLLAGTRKERGQPSSILSISEQGSKVGLDNCVFPVWQHMPRFGFLPGTQIRYLERNAFCICPLISHFWAPPTRHRSLLSLAINKKGTSQKRRLLLLGFVITILWVIDIFLVTLWTDLLRIDNFVCWYIFFRAA